jgi:hypothetical protein
MQHRPQPNLFSIFTITKNTQFTGNGIRTSKAAKKDGLPVPDAAPMDFMMNEPWSRGASSHLVTLYPSKAA